MAEHTTPTTQFATVATDERPLPLTAGGALAPVTLAYKTYGTLSPARDNAVLLFHALTGSHHAAGHDPHGPALPEVRPLWAPENHTGWWDDYIGPGRALDTSRYFVICATYLGSCYGSTGPNSLDPATNKPYGSRFPWVSITDVVHANARLLEQLEIERVHAVVGGSVGGFCATEFALQYPDRVRVVMPIASGFHTPNPTRVLNFQQIYAIESDPNFHEGDYYEAAEQPTRGITMARMIGHMTFVSLKRMQGRTEARIVQPEGELSSYRMQHAMESYILHHARKFTPRFDANAYLRILNMWQGFDVAAQHTKDGNLVPFFAERCREQTWLLFSIDSDVCFEPAEQYHQAQVLKQAGVAARYLVVHSDKGHDSFLLDPELYAPQIRAVLDEAQA